MKSLNDLPGWLNRYSCPAFTVKENSITACNQSAEALLLQPGMDIRELLVTGAEEYAAFRNGCLYLKLKTSTKGCGASVTNVEDCHLFLLDQEPEVDEGDVTLVNCYERDGVITECAGHTGQWEIGRAHV